MHPGLLCILACCASWLAVHPGLLCILACYEFWLAMNSDRDQYNELAFCTLAHKDPAFIHQHLVVLLRRSVPMRDQADDACVCAHRALSACRKRVHRQAGSAGSHADSKASEAVGSAASCKKARIHHCGRCAGYNTRAGARRDDRHVVGLCVGRMKGLARTNCGIGQGRVGRRRSP
jgi:hypothetical protein